jgi:ribosomal protein L40E
MQYISYDIPGLSRSELFGFSQAVTRWWIKMATVSRGKLHVTKLPETEQSSPEERQFFYWVTLSFKHKPYGVLQDYLIGEGFKQDRNNHTTRPTLSLRTWNRIEALKKARSLSSWILANNHEKRTVQISLTVQPQCLECLTLLSFGADKCDFCGSEYLQPKGKVRLSDGEIFFNGKKKREVAE